MDRLALRLGIVAILVIALAPSPSMATPAVGPTPDAPSAQLEPVDSTPLPARAWLGPDGETLPFRNDSEVIEFMRTAEVVSMKELTWSKTRPYKVLLEKDGVRMNAIFRTVDVRRERVRIGDRFHMFFRDNALFECAAYALAQLLGLENVPPAVARSINGRWGSLQVWVEGTMTGNDRRQEGLQPPDPQDWFLRTMVITVWDQLIFNDDRNPGNILIESDWDVWMVDHTRAFQRNSRLRDPDQVTHCERELWERLREVSDEEIRGAVAEYLNPAEIETLLERRQKLVDRIASRIIERGEGAVIYDMEPI
jgi:hypothetical protein